MNALDELARFQTDRGLHLKEFNLKASTINMLEEIAELHGDEDSYEQTDREFAEEIFEGYFDEDDTETTIEEKVDALADITVFALGDIMKLGYDPEKVLLEVSKEINSRVGTFIDGKFMKDKSEEAMKNWYKADFTNCKL